MTKVKCKNEGIFYICKWSVKGICTKPEITMEFELDRSESMSHHMECSDADLVYNGNKEEWNKYKHNRVRD